MLHPAPLAVLAGGPQGRFRVAGVATAPVDSITVTPQDRAVLTGGTLQLDARAFDASGADLPGTVFTWASSDDALATVDSNGLVTGVSPGAVVITASADGVDGTTDVLARDATGFSLHNVELPRAEVDTTYSEPTLATLTVSSTGLMNDGSTASDHTTIQQAVDAAVLAGGEHLILVANAHSEGKIAEVATLVLPSRDSGETGWIYIRPESMAQLPAAGTRLRVGTYGELMVHDPANLPGIEGGTLGASANYPAIAAEAGAHRYRLIGLHCTIAAGVSTGSVIVDLFTSETLAEQPHHILLDRCYLQGYYGADLRRGFRPGGPHMAFIDGEISDIICPAADSQAIWLSNAPGPFLAENSKLAADGENFMAGGEPQISADHIPSDLTFTRCWFLKPEQWYTDEYVDGVRSYSVKNNFELKCGVRVLVEDSVFENMWNDSQRASVNIKTVNQSGNTIDEAYVRTHDVTIRYCHVKKGFDGLSISGHQQTAAETCERHAYQHVLVEARGNLDWPAAGSGNSGRGALVTGDDPQQTDIFVEHVTFYARSHIMLWDQPGGVEVRSCIGTITDFDVFGTNNFTNATFQQNIWVGDNGDTDPSDFTPAANSEVGFRDIAARDFGLAVGSPALAGNVWQAHDGTDNGCHYDVLTARLVGVRD